MHEIDDKIILDKCSECGEWGLKTKEMKECLCCSNKVFIHSDRRNNRVCKEPGCYETVLQAFVVEVGVEAAESGIEIPPEEVGKVVNDMLRGIIQIHGPQCEVCLNNKFSKMMIPNIEIDQKNTSAFGIMMKKTERDYIKKKNDEFQKEWV